jgi:hypothetical protein
MSRHTVDLTRLKEFDIHLPIDDDGEIDLHNFANFVGMETSNGLRLRWVPFQVGKFVLVRRFANKNFQTEPISMLDWVFGGVSALEIGERDAEMPLTEDRTLDSFLLEWEPDGLHAFFQFHGGVKFRFVAKNTFVELTT